MSYSAVAAQELAVRALVHIAEHPDLASALLATSGLRPEALRQAARDPDFCVHVLDFLLEDDRRVLDFAQSLSIRPDEVLSARMALAGPGSFGWEPD
ncbi:DUF3572 domain-containing protein [Paracoccus methylarcula]|uniref:DUF3572 domain-containing protein n=1 Tax=Paracoccus methylarcula TaxID=72022 RepID=A0A3R7NW86_9RHOB|nr:DUF3572 domain-containing protein [Paracoccus methylarcula]RNF33384.1 DUF3572 domain-containing protein [Paracoccus methylarcula]